MLIKQFFDGIEDEDIKYQVKYLMQPRSLQEAIDKLREYDSYKGINREPVGRQAGNSFGREDRECRPNYFGERRQNHFTRAIYEQDYENPEKRLKTVNERRPVTSVSFPPNLHSQSTERDAGTQERNAGYATMFGKDYTAYSKTNNSTITGR